MFELLNDFVRRAESRAYLPMSEHKIDFHRKSNLDNLKLLKKWCTRTRIETAWAETEAHMNFEH